MPERAVRPHLVRNNNIQPPLLTTQRLTFGLVAILMVLLYASEQKSGSKLAAKPPKTTSRGVVVSLDPDATQNNSTPMPAAAATTAAPALATPEAQKAEPSTLTTNSPSRLQSPQVFSLQWKPYSCFPSGDVLRSWTVVSLAVEFCPSLLPTGLLQLFKERQTMNGTAPAPSSQRRSFSVQGGSSGPKKVRGGRSGTKDGGDKMPQDEHARRVFLARHTCNFLTFSTCGFVERGDVTILGGDTAVSMPRKSGDDVVPCSSGSSSDVAVANISSPAATRPNCWQNQDHLGQRKPQSTPTTNELSKHDLAMLNGHEEVIGRSSGFVSSSSMCDDGQVGDKLKASRQVGLLNQWVRPENESDGPVKDFSMALRASSSATEASNISALNTIQWLHWEPSSSLLTNSQSGGCTKKSRNLLQSLPSRPEPKVYRSSLEILQTIRSFQKQRFHQFQHTTSAGGASPQRSINKNSDIPKILISGDSLIRHFFFRFIFLLRGDEVISHDHPRRRQSGNNNAARSTPSDRPIMEHYLHGDLLYRLYDDHDEIEVIVDVLKRYEDDPLRWSLNTSDTVESYFHNGGGGGVKKEKKKGQSGGSSSTPLLEIHFLWDPRHVLEQNRILSTKAQSIGDGYTLHIHAANFWDLQTDPRTYLVELANHKPPSTPSKPMHPTILINGPPKNALVSKENERLMDFCQRAPIAKEKHFFCLDFDGLSAFFLRAHANAPEDIRCDTLHFMCNFVPMFPQPIESPKPHYCPNNPCRDDVNAAILQVLIDHLPLLAHV